MNEHEVIIRIILSMLVGGIIGYEREFNNRPAGLRTHILVCLGAALTSMIQLYIMQYTEEVITNHPVLASAMKADIGRFGAQVITGVGFLGAGTIIHEKGSVKGLTTAASIWTVACIGLAIGFGYYFLGVASAVSVFLVLVTLKKFENMFIDKENMGIVRIEYGNKSGATRKVADYFRSNSIKVKNIEFMLEEEDKDDLYSTRLYTILAPRHHKIENLIDDLRLVEGILKVERVK